MTRRLIFLVFGAVLFAGLIHTIGIETLLHHLVQVGWWIIPILLLSPIWYAMYAQAWRRILAQRRLLPLRTLFRIKIVGEGVNTLTPANFVGGDPVRILLLRRHFPGLEGAASVVIDRTLHSLATIIVILMAAVASFWRIPDLPLNIRYGLPIILLILCGFITFVIAHQHRGLFQLGLDLLKRTGIRRHVAQPTVDRLQALDAAIASFYHRDQRGFWTALLWHTAGRMLGILEIYGVGHLIMPDFGLIESVILAGLAPLVHLCFTFIPGAFGIMEGAYGGTLFLLAFPPSLGLTIQVVKRLRAAIWIAIGSFLMGRKRRERTQRDHLSSAKSRW
jgi:uncharacterized protein (TIRG00374 family)